MTSGDFSLTGDSFSNTGTYANVTVGNATNAGDADTLDGSHASAFALTSHKYHSFSTGDYYFDPYAGSNYFRLFTENSKADILRYRPVSNIEYFNGTSWASTTLGVTNALDNSEATTFNVPSDRRTFRFEINKSSGWPTTTVFVLQTTWSNPQHGDITVTIENWDGVSWVQKDIVYFNAANTSSSSGYHAKVLSSIHDGNSLSRLTFEFAD